MKKIKLLALYMILMGSVSAQVIRDPRGNWTLLPGADGKVVTISDKGIICMVNKEGKLFSFTGSEWKYFGHDELATFVQHDEVAIKVYKNGLMARKTSSNPSWLMISGSDAQDIALLAYIITEQTSTIPRYIDRLDYWMVNTAGKIYKGPFWGQLPGSDAARIAAGPKQVWMVNSIGKTMTETSAATDAMGSIIEKRKNDQAFFLPVLATTGYPTIKTTEIIKQLAFGPGAGSQPFIQSTAQLTLGGMANHFRAVNPVYSDELTNYLVSSFQSETDSIQHILVLGNTGSYIVFPILRNIINNKAVSTGVKEETIKALQLIKHPAIKLYLDSLAKSPDTLINKVAMEVLNMVERNN